MEADPTHVEILLREVGCETVTSPWVKELVEEALEPEDLDGSMIATYRSASMRLAYISQDRPDLRVLGKELAKGLKRPTQALAGVDAEPVISEHFQDWFICSPTRVSSRIDNCGLTQIMQDAGCIRSRKSSTGTGLQLGKANIKTTCSKSQAVIAVGSGEAEYYGLVSGLSQALREQSTLKDWGIHVPNASDENEPSLLRRSAPLGIEGLGLE